MADHLVARRARGRHRHACTQWLQIASSIVIMLLVLTSPAMASDGDPPKADAPLPGAEGPTKPPEKLEARESDTRESICLIVEAAARDNNLPLEFFARVI